MVAKIESTYWLSKNVFEEPDSMRNVHDSYLYSWRSFTNPANSSYNNAYELGNRPWNKEGKFGQRRAMMEEAQEVKAIFFNSSTGRNDSGAIPWAESFRASTCRVTSTMAMWTR